MVQKKGGSNSALISAFTNANEVAASIESSKKTKTDKPKKK